MTLAARRRGDNSRRHHSGGRVRCTRTVIIPIEFVCFARRAFCTEQTFCLSAGDAPRGMNFSRDGGGARANGYSARLAQEQLHTQVSQRNYFSDKSFSGCQWRIGANVQPDITFLKRLYDAVLIPE